MGRVTVQIVKFICFIALICLLGAGRTAAAQGTGQPYIELLPPGQAIGDGETTLLLHALVLDAGGNPVAGLRTRTSASGGTIGGNHEAGPGLYAFEWTPPKVEAQETIEINFKIKGSGFEQQIRKWSVPVSPGLSHQLSIAAEPAQVVLGQDTSANITISLVGSPSQPLSGVDIDVRASAGTISNITHQGGGRFTALYTPPQQLYPRVVLITAVDKRDPTRTYASISLPLVGKANFPVMAVPNAAVMVTIGDQQFGPAQASPTGSASVPLVVSPGNGIATITSIMADGQRVDAPLDLKVPPSLRVAMFPVPGSIPADPAYPVAVRAMVTTPTGLPDTAAKVTFTTTTGTISAARHEGNGVYVATFTPPLGNSNMAATIQVAVEDAVMAQTDAVTANLVQARPAAVEVTADPATLDQGTRQVQLFVDLKSSDGSGLTSRSVSTSAIGATVAGGSREMGGGTYQITLNRQGEDDIAAVAVARQSPSENALSQVLVLASRERIPNDGKSTAMVTILTVDEHGYPVANQPVGIQLSAGDGAVGDTAITDGAGIAQLVYTAGATVGLVSLRAVSGDHVGECAMLQGPASFGAGVALPASGDSRSIETSKAWRSLAPVVLAEKPAPVVVAAQPVVPTPVVTQPAVAPAPVVEDGGLTVTNTPAEAVPGGAVMIMVNAKDPSGKPLIGAQLMFSASAGVLTPAVDFGNGTYQATLVVPPNVKEPIGITVMSADGMSFGGTEVPIKGMTPKPVAAVPVATQPVATQPAATQPAATQPAATQPVATTQPAATEPTTLPQPATSQPFASAPVITAPPPVVVRPPKEKSGWPWLRVQGGYLGGLYGYEQVPQLVDGKAVGTLYKQEISFGRDGTPSAPTAGLALRARAFMPTMDWLGLDLSYRSSYYSVDIRKFEATVPDWVSDLGINAVARYSTEISGGANQVSAGARLGYSYSDFLVYEVGSDGTNEVLLFNTCPTGHRREGTDKGCPFPVYGFNLGFEGGLEMDNGVFGLAGLDLGFTSGSGHYLTAVDLTGGYAFTENIFADLGFFYSGRAINTFWQDASGEKVDVGDLADSNKMFTIGVGYQL